MAELVKWEYKMIQNTDTDVLNSLGQEGWELVTVLPYVAYLKRPVAEEVSPFDEFR